MNTLLNRSFVSVIFAQIASLFGDAVLRFALPLYVLNQTGSAALMGAVSACAWIPYIVLTPIGGVAADRVNKRRIMAALDILLAATCAAFLALDGVIDLVGLCICALIVLYAAQSVYQPTVQAAVPFIVPRDGIVRATAIVSQISALSGLVGPVLGGLLFGLFGIEPVVFVSGAAFAVSAVLIVTVVRIPRDAIERSGVGVVRTVANDIVESFAFLRHERTVILKVIFLVAGINVTLTAFILIGAPVVITQILGLPNQYMGFAEGALALGGLAGGVSVGVFAGRLRLSRAPLFLLVAALGLLPIAVVLGVPMDAMLAYGIVVAGLFASMACATMFSIQAISFVQLETPGHLVGKVIALTMSLANCAQPVGQLIYGGLFDAPGRLDIFNCFRRPDEASMAGGVFIVVECKDKKSWQVLKAKGHPCSRNDRYAALYHPAHLLGVETGTSVLAAALMKHATGGGNLRPLCDLCGRAVRDLPKGTVLDMGGHHHTIDGVEGVLNPAAAIGPDAPLPFYLLSHRTLCRDVPAGKLITLGDLDMPEESTLLRLRREQDKAFGLVK